MKELLTDQHESIALALDEAARAFWANLAPGIRQKILEGNIQGLTYTSQTLEQLLGSERYELFLMERRVRT